MTPLRALLLAVACATVLGGAGCGPRVPPATPSTAAPGAPRYPDYPTPVVPAGLGVEADLRQRHADAWTQLQAGDLRSAERGFRDVLKRAPTFFPASTGLGFVALAGRHFQDASTGFTSALRLDTGYVPALIGQAEALLGLKRPAEAMAVLERVIGLDPGREGVRARLDLLRFRATQDLIDEARIARQARRGAEAERLLTEALRLAPESPVILRELSGVTREAGRLEEAEAYARRAMALDASGAEAHAWLGAILEVRERLTDAAASYAEADRLEPRAEWREKARDLAVRGGRASLPPEFLTIASAPRVTRADVAAMIGIRFAGTLAQAPRRVTDIATDVRSHWAAPWILPVTAAGLMRIYANHTFQPNAIVRRGDLAVVLADLARLSVPPETLNPSAAARPRLADVPPTNATYRAVALVTAAGILTVGADGRFEPGRVASGAEVTAALDRVAALSASR